MDRLLLTEELIAIWRFGRTKERHRHAVFFLLGRG